MMKIVRFEWQGRASWGILEENERIFALEGDVYGKFKEGKEICRLEEARLLAPADPRVMVACALNYTDHAKELGRALPKEPKLFFKPPNTLSHPLDEIAFPKASRDYRFEAELCVVLKRRAREVSEKEALDYVLGYTCGNDLGAFDFLEADGIVTRARGFDGSGPIGPWIATDLDPDHLSIKGRVNGEIKQDSNTGLMISGVRKLISHVSAFMTLQPGDVIWTGTPKGGACPVKAGDVMEVEIEGIGILKNKVASPGQAV